MNEFAELAPELPQKNYAELHRDPITGSLTFIEASPEDNVLYASKMGNHSMLDELRVMYHGQLPPEYLFADGLNTETVAGKGSVEQTPDGPVLRINHFRNKGDKTEKELLDEVIAAVSDKGIVQVVLEPKEFLDIEPEQTSIEERRADVRADIRQLPDSEISEDFFNPKVDSGVVTSLRYDTDENGQKVGTLQTIQAHSIIHQPALEAAGFNARGMLSGMNPVLFTQAGEPVLGGIRYVVDDRNDLFAVSLISSNGVNREKQLEVLQTTAKSLYDELGLDANYRQEYTIGNSRGVDYIDPAEIMEPNSLKAALHEATRHMD